MKPTRPEAFEDRGLAKRYQQIACSIVHISAGALSGTGFYIDAVGTIATATHVIYATQYGGTQSSPTINLVPHSKVIQLATYGGDSYQYSLPDQLQPADFQRATADLSLISTGHPTKCHLALSKHPSETVGEHLLAVGWPGLADNQVLYEGFLSSTGKALPFPVGQIGGLSVYPQYRLLRVQMPITPGASGGPLIDDHNEVIGVISQAPVVWAGDLNQLVQTYGFSGQGSGVFLSGFDVTKLLGELALVVHEFETSGSGLAIPVSYFQPPQAATAKN